MVKLFSNPQKLLFLLTILYLVTRYLRAQGVELPSFFIFHFTDLLFIPIQLTICLISVRLLKRDHRICIPVSLVGCITGWMAVLFEWYLPVYKGSNQHTPDGMDVLMYCFGGCLFLILQKTWLSPDNQ